MNKDEIFEKEATYVSPITVELHKIQREYNRKLDTLILNEIRKYDVKVDKDELVKALKYDRNQYEKGYADGKEMARAILQELKNILVKPHSFGDERVMIELLSEEHGIELE